MKSRCVVRIVPRLMLLVAGAATLPGCTGWFSGSAFSWMKAKPSPTPAVSTASTDTTASTGGLFSKKQAGPDLYVATARLCESRGDFPGAEAQYENALKQAPNNVPALLSYAHLLDHENKLAEATKLYQRAIKANPKEAAAFNDLGLCLARQGKNAEAQTNLAKAVQLQPDKPLYRNNLAMLLVDQHKADEALAQLKAVNNEAVANYDLGILLEQRHQDALALAHFQRAVDLDPSFAAAREWTQQLAQRGVPVANPMLTAQVPPSQPLRVASVANPPPRYSSYGVTPQPAAGSYNQPQVPPTPQSLGYQPPGYQPQLPLNNELRALPPVQ